MSKRPGDLTRFYRLMGELESLNGGKHRLATAVPEGPWPRRGVAFFFEPSEKRADGTPRVVRVATHALKAGLNSTLWDRLEADKGGAHRQSPFRMLIGLGLLDLTGNTAVQSWGRGQDVAAAARERAMPVEQMAKLEATVEQAVNMYVAQMPFLCLEVPDAPGPASDRAFIEKNAIALLSNFARPPIDPPSANWLGRRSGREKVRQSGLWNLQHVDEAYDPSFMDTMKSLMHDMKTAREA